MRQSDNIHAIAHHAQVSTATVSRVLNGSTLVRQETRQRVLSVIKEMDYEPSRVGQLLRESHTNLIAVVIPEIANPFYTEVIHGINDALAGDKYNVLVCESQLSGANEGRFFELVHSRLVDGMISMDPDIDREMLSRIASRYPVVQCAEHSDLEAVPYVTIDNRKAAYAAVRFLHEKGRRRIAFIGSDDRYIYSRHRREGYLQALTDFQLAVNENWQVTREGNSFSAGAQAVDLLLASQGVLPDAIFAVSDLLAIGATRRLFERGFRVPADVTVFGFDNISLRSLFEPRLPTIAQPMYQMGIEAAKLLLKRIHHPEQAQQSITLDFTLMSDERGGLP